MWYASWCNRKAIVPTTFWCEIGKRVGDWVENRLVEHGEAVGERLCEGSPRCRDSSTVDSP